MSAVNTITDTNSNQPQHQLTLDEKSVTRLFQQYITERGPKQLFMRFLRQRFNHEMLLFLDDVKAFDRIPSSLKKEKFERAQLLTSKYIESDGELELNLRHDIKHSMLQQVEQYKAQWKEVERKDAAEQRKVLLEQLEGLEKLLADLKERVTFQLRDECFGDFLLSDHYANRKSYLEDLRRPSKTLEQIKAERAAEKDRNKSRKNRKKTKDKDSKGGRTRWSIRYFFSTFGRKKSNVREHRCDNESATSNGALITCAGSDANSTGNVANGVESAAGHGRSKSIKIIDTNAGTDGNGIQRRQTARSPITGTPISAERRRKSFFGLNLRSPKDEQSVTEKNTLLVHAPGSPSSQRHSASIPFGRSWSPASSPRFSNSNTNGDTQHCPREIGIRRRTLKSLVRKKNDAGK